MLIFAYGSNMLLARMRERAPSATRIDTGYVTKRVLRFHKKGLDGSGKADAFHTGDQDDRVWGVIYEIERSDLTAIDQAESLGVGYDRKSIDVRTCDNGATSAAIYIATPSHRCNTVRPFEWYRQLVLSGGVENRLPRDYLAELEEISAVRDSDRMRAELHLRLLKQ